MNNMGTVNNQSVREEAQRIKSEFDRISANKKINNETKMLIQSMFMLINLLISIFLEKTTKKNNKNSSKPSSQTEKDESYTNPGTNNKGKQENNMLANNTRTVEIVEIAKVLQCDVCGEDLSKAQCQHIERRTKIDIIFEKVKKLSLKSYANVQKRYRNILTRGKNEMPMILPKPNGKRGKIAKSDAHNLLERLKEHESAVLLFAKNSAVTFTNNHAERDLRMSKVKQKVSGCFRKELYAKDFCRISSYLQTMGNKGINPLIAIQMALTGKID